MTIDLLWISDMVFGQSSYLFMSNQGWTKHGQIVGIFKIYQANGPEIPPLQDGFK